MPWETIIKEVFTLVLIPLLGIVAKYFVQFINIKAEELKAKTENDTFKKYIGMLNGTISNAVIATNQTYVDSLKEQGKFDGEAQKIALEKTYTAVMATLTTEAKSYLNTAIADLQTYILTAIESQVKMNK